MSDDIAIYLSVMEADILLIQLKELEAKTTTVNWIIKYLEKKLKKEGK